MNRVARLLLIDRLTRPDGELSDQGQDLAEEQYCQGWRAGRWAMVIGRLVFAALVRAARPFAGSRERDCLARQLARRTCERDRAVERAEGLHRTVGGLPGRTISLPGRTISFAGGSAMSADPAVEALIADGTWNASPLGACGVRRMVRGRVAEGLVRLVREVDAAVSPDRERLIEAGNVLADALRSMDSYSVWSVAPLECSERAIEALVGWRAALAADREPERAAATEIRAEDLREVRQTLIHLQAQNYVQRAIEAFDRIVAALPPEGESE